MYKNSETGMESMIEPRLSFSQMLVSNGLVSQIVIDYVRQKQAVEGQKLGRMLVELGFISAKDLARQLAIQRGIEFRAVPAVDPEVAAAFNRSLCLTHNFLPVGREGDKLRVLLGDAEPEAVATLIQRRVGQEVVFWQGEFFAVIDAIHQHYYFQENPVERLIEAEIRKLGDDRDHAYSPDRLMELILHTAVRERATDVHLAPTAHSRGVLMRIDGVLRPMFAMPPSLDRLVAFIKLKADMDASEQRLPQDGSFTINLMDATYTIRVSTMISEFGERVAMRLLAERSDLDRLQDLGFLEDDVAEMEKAFARPHGLILITGPTGSGKSTTLHAALRVQPLVERNVLTVEDPVEYRVPVACQTEVNRRAGYDFASAMRHFLRHDPDIILVGEVRDAETARAALDASSTGHLVLSTLHVGGIFGVVPRLRLLGVDAETVAENLVAVINQRLVRCICPYCKAQRAATEDEKAWLGPEVSMVHHGVGCSHCRGTGYRGRLPVYEILTVKRELADAIVGEAPRARIRELAEASGLKPMVGMARYRVLQGETTVDEVRRAIGLE
ncbi:MAG TPA: secretion system protein [Hydrogenophaga sp.]|jgi:general secretion pathway protein E|uniref:GspE/PulE family protein n=1 Tax=Hydrogenophaga sp. TaxID=1904254 RepID=UPI000ACD7145|nr:GspE/PulE family protein [Hydrogenophaga sp.]PKO76289.1 MAG: secretion system protein [Betaproteobacteria bacterium HGW-Betaproteobacteria-15]HAX22153.1 secretion system protein [Hydrogenophaga sp.]HBU19701.1 secretion system protein [Hydrogenophaga sp.]